MASNWWETSSGDHIEPLGGGASALAKAFTGGEENDVSRAIESHRDLTFGTGEKPGILGTGRFVGNYYQPGADAAQVPGYQGFQQQIAQGYAGAPVREGMQMNGRQQQMARGQQQGLANALQARVNGTGGPSVAEQQMNRGLNQNMSQAMAMMAAQRGQNAGGSMRQIANQRAMMGQQGVADAGVMRAQEQMGAENTLGQLLAGMRGQDIGVASGNAQLGMQQRQMNDDMTKYYMAQGLNLAQAQQQAAMDLERLRVQQNIGANQIQAQSYENARKGNSDLLSMVGSFVGMSDERVKKDIRSAEGDTYSFLDALNASRYSYKDEKHGKGERVSVMAQELERSELGKAFVKETSEGKAVDYAKGLGTMLAAQSSLHKRLKKLEGGS